MKKILFITNAAHKRKNNAFLNYQWCDDCQKDYIIDFWGKRFGGCRLSDLKNKIDKFRPDFIYASPYKSCADWLPDLTSIKVPKIFVECDTWKYNSNNEWYKQFNKLMCRQQNWYFHDKNILLEFEKMKNCNIIKNNSKTWENVQLFRWSVSENNIYNEKSKNRRGIYFIGHFKKKMNYLGEIIPDMYLERGRLKDRFLGKVEFDSVFGNDYWERLRSASALICPTESIFGDYVPAKLFEYLASGAAVLTNCDMKSYGISDLEPFVIKYTDLKDLESKLDMDFTPYHNKALDAMRNHTHRVRYREIFG